MPTFPAALPLALPALDTCCPWAIFWPDLTLQGFPELCSLSYLHSRVPDPSGSLLYSIYFTASGRHAGIVHYQRDPFLQEIEHKNSAIKFDSKSSLLFSPGGLPCDIETPSAGHLEAHPPCFPLFSLSLPSPNPPLCAANIIVVSQRHPFMVALQRRPVDLNSSERSNNKINIRPIW